MDITYYKKYEPIFGSWKIAREIGEGSFGKVFEIQREDFGYTYKAALKAITIPQSKSEIDRIMDDGMDSESVTEYFRGFVQELIEEFRLMSKLKGESTVVSYEDHTVIEHSDGIGWDVLIRMELLTPLTSHAKENELNRDDIIRLGIDICKALELCRRNNIIHRDIKPENVFISENGRFKLGDFGIAKTVEKTTGGLSKKGTYTYMAPEVYKGEKYGPGVDIYSLGIMLYRYLNHNRTPFLPDFPQPIKYIDRETAMARRISGEEIPAPANADAELAAVILKACAYNPKGRYSSPTEMREALEAVAAKRVSAPVTEKPSVIAEDGDKTVGVFGSVKPAVAEEIAQAAVIPEAPTVNKFLEPSESETVKEPPLEENKTVGVFGSVKPAVAEEIAQAAAIPEAPAVNEVLEPSDAEAVKETPLEEDKTEAICLTAPNTEVTKMPETREEKFEANTQKPTAHTAESAQAVQKKKKRKQLIIAVIALVAAVVASIITKYYPHTETRLDLIAHYGWFNNLEYAEAVNYSDYGTETIYYNSDIESVFKAEWRDSSGKLRLAYDESEGISKDLKIYDENGQVIRSFSADWDAEKFSLTVDCAGGCRPSEFSWKDKELGGVYGKFDENYNLIYLDYWEKDILVYFSESGEIYNYHPFSSEIKFDASEYDYLQFDYPGADEAEYRDIVEFYTNGVAFMCVLREGWEDDAPPVAVIHYESGEIRTLLYRYDDGYGWVF
ncbi:MAG: protein kinase [Bacillota bacterium]|nr:protein kinase [Bacillota bacterium]